MKFLIIILLCLGTWAFALAARHVKLLPFVQEAPDQGEANTCLYMASTGALELLLNQKHNVRSPKVGGRFDLSEPFIIHQTFAPGSAGHWIETVVQKFNHGEAVHASHWPFVAFNPDGTDSSDAWVKRPDILELPRMEVPEVTTELLFARSGNKWATGVLEEEDLELMKTTLKERNAPLIVNYNDDDYWHVVLIVGFDDDERGDCYDLETCEQKGTFYVRDSNGKRYEKRAYQWFLEKGNTAAVIELK